MPKVYNRQQGDAPPEAVYVGRPSKWGNPFRMHTTLAPSRDDAVELYVLHVTTGEGRFLDFTELKGKDLVCWCAPLPCHADILLELANWDWEA